MNVGFTLPTRIGAVAVERSLDLRGYLQFLWRQWKLIGAVTLLSLVIAWIYLAHATPQYTATAQILLDPRREKGIGADAPLSDFQLYDLSAIESQLAIIKSEPLLRRVVIKERLAEPQSRSGDASNDGANAADAGRVQNAVNALRGALGVSRNGQAYVLNVSITSQDPVKAARLANAVADAYVVDQLDAGFEAARRASAWLGDRLVELRQQLRDSEEAVAKFRTEHGLVRTSSNVALNEQQVAELNSKLLAARADAAEKKTRVEFLAEVAAGKKSLESLPDSFTSQQSVMGNLRQRLAEASQREADLLARYNSRHPEVVNVQAEKRDIERSIAAETQRIIMTVKTEYALAKARQDATELAMREATGQGELDAEEAVRLRELERTAAVNKSLFEDFLQKAKITAEQSTFQARDARVIMPAQLGGQTFPNIRLVWMLALFAGVGFGVGGALSLELLNGGFTTAKQVEEMLGVPVLASVIRMHKSKLKKNGVVIPLPRYQIYYPLSSFSEAMRMLRSGIHMSDVDEPPKVIHVTSARPSEGKTTVAISLAISAASSGMKVALVDADLRHPSTTQFFKLEDKKGLVDLLTSAAMNGNAMMYRKDNVTIIPAGSKSLNPPDVLGSQRMKMLIGHLKDEFDYVVLDTPPVGPVADAHIAARLADKTVFVVEWASTPREMVQDCVQHLSNHKRIAGIVMNRVNPDRAKKHGGGYYYADAYYGKYYSE